MAKDGLHALELRVLGQLDLSAHLGGQLPSSLVHLGEKVRLEALLSL